MLQLTKGFKMKKIKASIVTEKSSRRINQNGKVTKQRSMNWVDVLKRQGNHLFLEFSTKDLSTMKVTQLRMLSKFMECHLTDMISSKNRLIERILEKGESIDEENNWFW